MTVNRHALCVCFYLATPVPCLQETWPRLRNVSVTVPDSSSSKLSAPGKDLSETEKSAWFGRNLDTTAVEIQAPLGSSDEVGTL